MALKVVNTESLDAVANAINAKSGTSGALQFPDGFVDAIGAIQAGGGGEDLSTVLAEQEELVAELKSIIAQKAKLGDAKLPSVVDGTVTELTAEDLAGTTKIRNYAFYYNANLKSIILPNGVTSIGQYAFNYCDKLIHVTIPNSVTTIGRSAFSECTLLDSVILSENLTLINDYLFYNVRGLDNINIPNGVTSIGKYAFYTCPLKIITIPNSVESIGDYAFQSGGMATYIVIGNGVASIGKQAFAYNGYVEYVDMTAYGTDKPFPTLSNTNAFQGCGINTTAKTFEIRVSSGRKAELAAMTNWSTYADNIVEV